MKYVQTKPTIVEENAYTINDAVRSDTKFMYAGRLKWTKRWKRKAHAHPFCEVLLVLSGMGRIVANGVEYSVREGDIIVYNPHVLHEEFTVGDDGVEIGFFGISEFQVGGLPVDHLIKNDSCPVFNTGENAEKFKFYFYSLAREAEDDREYSDHMARCWVKLIFTELLRLVGIHEVKFVTNASFAKIHRFLSQHFAEIDSIDQVCRELNVSKYYISHVFKDYIGVPPMQYVTVKRIAYAKKLLQETDSSVTEIGRACGYVDHVLFFKNFKKLEGITPLAYRKSARANMRAPRG